MSDFDVPPPEAGDDLPLFPHSREAEEALIGSVLIDGDWFGSLRDGLRPQDFYIVRHSLIWEAFAHLAEAHQAIDFVTVAGDLQATGQLEDVGGLDYLAALIARTGTSLNAESYARIVREHAGRRAFMRLAGQLVRSAGKGEPVTEIAELLRREAALISGADPGSAVVDAETLAEAVYAAVYAGAGEETVISSGLADLDSLLRGGLRPGALYIIGGRPGCGKSALLLGIAGHAAAQGRRVGLFTLEMPNQEQAERLLSQLSGVPHEHIARRKLGEDHWPPFRQAVDRMGAMPMQFDDTPSPTIPELRAKCRRMAEQGLDLLVVDSLNLLNPEMNGTNLHERINWLAYQLKILARELEVPVLAAHHMSRRFELGGERQPELSDLEQAGEKPADVVAFLYGKRAQEGKSEGGQRLLKLAKHRSGPTGVVRLTFLADTLRFVNAATVPSNLGETRREEAEAE